MLKTLKWIYDLGYNIGYDDGEKDGYTKCRDEASELRFREEMMKSINKEFNEEN